MKYPNEIKEKTRYFPFAPENKFAPKDKFTDYMNNMKGDSYTQCKKLICDWTDKKNCLVHYRMLKFFVKHGMIVEKVLEVISFKQRSWLKPYIDFNTKKRNKVDNDFEKDFYKLLNNAFYGKTMENVRNRIKVEFIKKDEEEKIVKQQSKLTFNGIHKSYENYDSFTFKQNLHLKVEWSYVWQTNYFGFRIYSIGKRVSY